jgi:hypothetical protein
MSVEYCELCGSEALRVSEETGFLICDDCGTQSQVPPLPIITTHAT